MKNKASQVGRRTFLKSSVFGASGLVVSTTALHAGLSPRPGRTPGKSDVISRTLGKTGIKLPIVSMGVMNSDNPNLVRAALDNGIVHLDTAHVYQRGNNEVMLGEVLKDYPRESYILATKVRPDGRNRSTGSYDEAATVENFMEKFDISMQRLGLDYVDILYHHNVSTREAALHPNVLEAMKRIKESGRARFVGITTHSNEPDVIEAAIESNFYEVVLTVYNFKYSNIEKLNAAIKKAAEAGLGIVAMKTMAGGWLDRERTQPVNAKAALKWALQNEHIHTSIPGFTTYDQMEDDIQVMTDLELTDQEKSDIAFAQDRQGLYCSVCNECIPQCQKGLPIPDYMRAFMYTYGYRNLAKARDLVASLGHDSSVCDDCGSCSIRCSKGFNISEKIRDVSRILDVPPDFVS
jgi:predicted aldo/keto reductase-like oxidoreductase